MVRCWPADSELARLPTPLNEGESRTFEALRRLPDTWDVFVQPQLGLMQPDFLLVNDSAGVVLVEVKDWTPDHYRQRNGSIQVRGEDGWRTIGRHPCAQVKRYLHGVFEECFAMTDRTNAEKASIRGVLLLPRFDEAAARGLVGPIRNTTVGGAATLDGLGGIVGGLFSAPPRPESIAKLRRHLVEPESRADQRQPLILSPGAKNVAVNPAGAGIRRVRGPAGSGKSQGLAVRAVNLAHDGKSVLVLCFNITLRQYLQDLMARHARDIGDPACRQRITVVHLHDFLSTLYEEEDLGSSGGSMDDWSERVVAGLDAAYRQGRVPQRTYDAVLIDEGQDFQRHEWNLLREHIRRPDGEILIVADRMQDLYEHSAWTDEPSMRGAGFSGPWTTLKGTYRIPMDLIPILHDFARLVELGETGDLPTIERDHPGRAQDPSPTVRRWLNANGQSIHMLLAGAVESLLQEHGQLAVSDIVVLASHRTGLAAMHELDRRGLRTNHIFADNDDEKKRRKRRFWGGAPGVKGSTINSFKGWEARAVVVSAEEFPGWPMGVYTALTRVKGDRMKRSAYITVVNAIPDLESFKAVFERELPGQLPIDL